MENCTSTSYFTAATRSLSQWWWFIQSFEVNWVIEKIYSNFKLFIHKADIHYYGPRRFLLVIMASEDLDKSYIWRMSWTNGAFTLHPQSTFIVIASKWATSTNLENFYFCVSQKKDNHSVLEWHESE